MTPEQERLIKDFNRNIEWLKRKELKENYTASASEVMKITGWSREKLRGERERGTIRSKKCNGKCRYDLSSLPEIYKQKVIYATDSPQRPQLVRV
ncbi:MAG TPA: hypothetical protein PL085_11435 [Agriterribacter sp.]|uniref:hypothetical protein n=1 Tax=Agriterribacter sp. TaxID=2821509 RepID=UPI002C14E141|nr:hypothetical protein [Agriterribacter sp.]HRQ17681.1 hypothetical protein [Agriterribacter sp.]